ncbi:MAG: hypothetical protein E7G66_09440 [Veillonella sp.]|uniref:hypothetical protein n=1 Tax=Veillonella sp. TaxID=1926307 RepID=UPI00290DDD3E|nr:hypothetical protein [Veillonella sp.]MDU3820673.1 hypothetical protein [Veillonella sp.]
MTHTRLTQLVQALLDAPTSNETVKEFAQSWINAEGTPNAKDIKAEGAEFCDCPGCVAAKNIIDLKAEIE